MEETSKNNETAQLGIGAVSGSRFNRLTLGTGIWLKTLLMKKDGFTPKKHHIC